MVFMTWPGLQHSGWFYVAQKFWFLSLKMVVFIGYGWLYVAQNGSL